MFSWLLYLREFTRDIFPPYPELPDSFHDLTGKVYAITGATAGIGKEVARTLLRSGAKLWILGRSEAKIEQLRQEFSDYKKGLRLLQIRFEYPRSLAKAIAPLLAEEKSIHGIIHNAGMDYCGPHYTDLGYLDVLTVDAIAPWVLQSHLDPLIINAAKSWPKCSVHIGWYHLRAITRVLSISAHPGTIRTDFGRDDPEKFKYLDWVQREPTFGAYAELAVLLSPDISEVDDGKYFVPFAQRARVRPDVWEGCIGENCDKCYKWLEETRALCE